VSHRAADSDCAPQLLREVSANYHFVDGVLLLSGLKQSPVDYASNYYLHLSMIVSAIGRQFFYLAQAAWMLIFGYTRADLFSTDF
jgi:hypothetical protein